MSIASAIKREKRRKTEQQRQVALYRAQDGVGKDATPPWKTPKEAKSYLPKGTKINMRRVPSDMAGPKKPGFIKTLINKITGRGRGK